MKYLLILLSTFFFSSISQASWDFSYNADVFGQYYQRDFSRIADAKAFCLKRADWHDVDHDSLNDFCFVNSYTVSVNGYKRTRYEATFKSHLQSFKGRDLQSLLNQINDWKYYQVFTGIPFQFLEVFASEPVRL